MVEKFPFASCTKAPSFWDGELPAFNVTGYAQPKTMRDDFCESYCQYATRRGREQR